MKLLLLAIMTVSGSQVFAQNINTSTVRGTLQSTKLVVDVVCLHRQNSEGEGDVSYHYHPSSFKQISLLKRKGLPDVTVAERCHDGSSLTQVYVWQYANRREVENQIQNQGGYSTSEAVIHNASEVRNQLNGALNSAINSQFNY
jgi:hypothetical protein